jgi:hypothetical protein
VCPMPGPHSLYYLQSISDAMSAWVRKPARVDQNRPLWASHSQKHKSGQAQTLWLTSDHQNGSALRVTGRPSLNAHPSALSTVGNEPSAIVRMPQ